MKDYISYRMMQSGGVAAPLCSFVYITVNGEDCGLYLAAEAVEESFLKRNYGSDYGELYKPDGSEIGAEGGIGENVGFLDANKNSDELKNNEQSDKTSDKNNIKNFNYELFNNNKAAKDADFREFQDKNELGYQRLVVMM